MLMYSWVGESEKAVPLRIHSGDPLGRTRIFLHYFALSFHFILASRVCFYTKPIEALPEPLLSRA